jgi:hypothetical protein
VVGAPLAQRASRARAASTRIVRGTAARIRISRSRTISASGFSIEDMRGLMVWEREELRDRAIAALAKAPNGDVVRDYFEHRGPASALRSPHRAALWSNSACETEPGSTHGETISAGTRTP